MAQRALAAIVITDAVGFTSRAGNDEESALRELKADFAVMEAAAVSRGGTVIKTTGDGLLIKFDSAWEAVETALDIQTQFATRPADKFKHRMGVHLCDVVLEDNDAHGDGVNLAARLQEQAAPGGICLSKTMVDIVKSRLLVEPISHGMVQLKNIQDRTEIFEIGPTNAPRTRKNPIPAKANQGRNMGMTVAIVFVGVAIVGATVVIANKKTTEIIQQPTEIIREPVYRDRIVQAPASATQTKGPADKIDLRGGTPRPSNPAPTPNIPQPSKSVPSPAESKADVSTVKTDTQVSAGEKIEPGLQEPSGAVAIRAPALVELNGIRRRYGLTYDFDSMLREIRASKLIKELPNFATIEEQVTRLQQLKTVVETGIASSSVSSPIHLDFPATSGRAGIDIWPGSNSQVWVKKASGETSQLALNTLEPIQFRFLAQAIGTKSLKQKDLRPLLTNFDREYARQLAGSGYLGNKNKLKKGLSSEENPFIKG